MKRAKGLAPGRAAQLSRVLEKAMALHQAGQLQEALNQFDEALRIDRTQAAVHNNKGSTLRTLGRFDEALASFAEALRHRPDYANAHFNLGNTLRDLGRFEQAIASYDRAIRCQPDFGEAHNNRGIALHELARPDEAEAGYSEALRLNPRHAEASYNRGMLRLARFQFEQGHADYLSRWDARTFPSRRLRTSIPDCKRGELRGKVLLWAEQGLGDEVFYAGLLPQVLQRGVSVTLSADRRLHPALARAFPSIRLLDRQQPPVGDFDAQAPIGDLAWLLALDKESLGANRKPYFQADPARKATLVASHPVFAAGPVCGVAWRSANKTFGAAKSLALRQLAPLFATPGLQFVNLQYGAVDAEIEAVRQELGVTIHRIEDLDLFNDVEGLLALVDACSFVVTSSNVTAHLAGSLGQRTGVLLPHGGQARLWYWHDGAGDSFWYPSLRLFRQDSPSDWQPAVDACAQWVKAIP